MLEKFCFASKSFLRKPFIPGIFVVTMTMRLCTIQKVGAIEKLCAIEKLGIIERLDTRVIILFLQKNNGQIERKFVSRDLSSQMCQYVRV